MCGKHKRDGCTDYADRTRNRLGVGGTAQRTLWRPARSRRGWYTDAAGCITSGRVASSRRAARPRGPGLRRTVHCPCLSPRPSAHLNRRSLLRRWHDAAVRWPLGAWWGSDASGAPAGMSSYSPTSRTWGPVGCPGPTHTPATAVTSFRGPGCNPAPPLHPLSPWTPWTPWTPLTWRRPSHPSPLAVRIRGQTIVRHVVYVRPEELGPGFD